MNENDIERQLRQQSLARPSADIDQRMDSLFHRAASGNLRASLPAVPVWLAAAACLVCAAAGFAVRPLLVRQQPPSTVVVVVPLNEALARLLTGNRRIAVMKSTFRAHRFTWFDRKLQRPRSYNEERT